MGAVVVDAAKSGVRRLRREDYTYVKHDKVFSNWAVLIGPSDWEDHHLGKEGSEKYRIHNLPSSCSVPGLYELGIAAPRSLSGRKIKRRHVIVVYLGQAENVRTRLQHYGQAGSHLEANGSFFLHQKSESSSHQQNKSSNDVYVQQGPGLFTETFSKGFSIVFRWASMDTKAEAEKAEAQLLKVFDYAWNRGGNAARRPHDVLLKLEKLSSQTTLESLQRLIVQKKCLLFGKKVGIRIDGKKPANTEKVNERNTIPRIIFGALTFTRNRPHALSKNGSIADTRRNICGAPQEDGTICTAIPLKSRKRCPDHKGQKGQKEKNLSKINISANVESRNQGVGEHENEYRYCGVLLKDGSTCKIIPDKGRKRCNIHKGMRIPGQAK